MGRKLASILSAASLIGTMGLVTAPPAEADANCRPMTEPAGTRELGALIDLSDPDTSVECALELIAQKNPYDPPAPPNWYGEKVHYLLAVEVEGGRARVSFESTAGQDQYGSFYEAYPDGNGGSCSVAYPNGVLPTVYAEAGGTVAFSYCRFELWPASGSNQPAVPHGPGIFRVEALDGTTPTVTASIVLCDEKILQATNYFTYGTPHWCESLDLP